MYANNVKNMKIWKQPITMC